MRAVGATRARQIYVRECIRPVQGDRVLDIGCGPADILEALPASVRYHGIDVSPDYIRAAQAHYGHRATFKVARAGDARGIAEAEYDIALATGVLHHLDDEEAHALVSLALVALRPGGVFVSLDGCYVAGQSGIARALLDWDRGNFVRTPEAYAALVAGRFATVETQLYTNLLRVPYTHWLMRATKR
jgi:SAM-dependent methyltransferase